MCRCMTIAAVPAVAFAFHGGAQADVVIDTVTVGNPGKASDTRYETPGYGNLG